jgi:membrane-associated phospholipid phosphatase
MKSFVCIGTLVVTFALVGSPTPCLAEPAPRGIGQRQESLWKTSWPTFSFVEGVATVAAGLGTLALVLRGPAPAARWEGGVFFDEAVRDEVRLNSVGARRQARTLGNWPYYTAGVIPLLVDPIAVAWIAHGDPSAAANLALIGLEAFSYAGLSSFVSTRAFARERPDSAECREHPRPGERCSVDTESFWSGHTSITAAAAGLVCANHRYLPLWKWPVLDAGACALSVAGTVTTAVTRVVADRHYASDVLIGGVVGFGIGYAVPVFLHYERRRAAPTVSFLVARPCDRGCAVIGGPF